MGSMSGLALSESKGQAKADEVSGAPRAVQQCMDGNGDFPLVELYHRSVRGGTRQCEQLTWLCRKHGQQGDRGLPELFTLGKIEYASRSSRMNTPSPFRLVIKPNFHLKLEYVMYTSAITSS